MIHDYYANLFPCESVHRWASREWAGSKPHKREWGWEGCSGTPFVRWKSCATPAALRQLVSEKNVGKINLGAIFDTDPALRFKQQSTMVPVAREFVIDIDLDDYGGIDKNDLKACDRAWPLVAIGLEVAHRVLTQHFGFQHILKVYSGRRGGHLWVCDKRAAAMNDGTRAAIVAWMQPWTKNGGQRIWEYLAGHPNFTEIYFNLVRPFFLYVAIKPIEQGGLGMFELEFQRARFVESLRLPHSGALAKTIEEAIEPAIMFTKIEGFCADAAFKRLRLAGAVWSLVGPLLDVKVSTLMTHTLKIPFSVHPKTHRLSVPILHDALCDFKPAKRTPTVHNLFGNNRDVARRLLAAMVLEFDQFVQTLSASDTEKWVPAILCYPAPKRLKVHDLRAAYPLSSDRMAAHTAPISDIQRRVWLLQRSFTALAYAHEPETVQITTTSTERARRTVYPGNFLPFQYERYKALDDYVQTVYDVLCHARLNPDQPWHCFSKSYLVVVSTDPEFDTQTNTRLDRLAERLREPSQVCCVETKWGPEGVRSFLKQQLAPFLEEVCEI